VYDWLLFLHVLSATMLFATAVVFAAIGSGLPFDRRALAVANVLWAIGGLGTLVFGIWLAIDVDGYEVWDGWVIGAIVLWALSAETGRRAQEGFVEEPGPDGAATVVPAGNALLMHWLRTALLVALLVVMIYKPGA
jgi:hypothetical protein